MLELHWCVWVCITHVCLSFSALTDGWSTPGFSDREQNSNFQLAINVLKFKFASFLEAGRFG